MAQLTITLTNADTITKATMTVPDDWDDALVVDGRLTLDIPLRGAFRVEKIERPTITELIENASRD